MSGLDPLARLSAEAGLVIMGALHPEPDASIPAATETLVLLGPDGPRWEAVFARAVEATDGAPHPIDRWSRRVVTALADRLGAQALFPFDGPPWLPVLRWALDSGWAWSSPVGMLVHARAGLWFSCRGIVAFPERLVLPAPPAASPCASCATQPCRSACPVEAFASGHYDVPRCAAYLGGAGAQHCLSMGCAVRHACPAGDAMRPMPTQAARHMRAFLKGASPQHAVKAVDKSVEKTKQA